MTFLAEVVAMKDREIADLKSRSVSMAVTAKGPGVPSFAQALEAPGLSVIAEIKRRSPSKGDIAKDLDARLTAGAYAEGGAAAISCLTDATFFGARASDFAEARSAGLPVLRKDFILDEAQVEESAVMGASAVLLIVRLLDGARLRALSTAARERRLDVLFETHNETEVERALSEGASIIGVNNRDLDTLAVDPGLALRLRRLIPSGVLTVSESGLRSPADLRRAADLGFDAVLIGESLAASADPAGTLRDLRAALPSGAA